jgi:hypothetical protein
MHYFAIMLVLQVACIVHVFRNGRNTAWVMAIAFLPLVGLMAYFWVEILPGLRRNPRMRKVHGQIADKIDPDRNVRAALDAVAFSDTVGNRMALGDALAARGEHREAMAEYRAADAMTHRPDAVVIMRIATSATELGSTHETRTALARLPHTQSQSELDRRSYLIGRTTEDEGDASKALTIYEGIVGRVPGDEVRCRMAALYLKAGDKTAARRTLEEVQLRMKKMHPAMLREEADMYAWAKKTLSEL